MNFPLISLVTLLPAVGSLLTMVLPSSKEKGLKIIGILVSIATFISSIPLLTQFGIDDSLFEEKYYWIDTDIINTSYHLKVDGISLLLIMLTTFITPITILASWNSINIRIKEFITAMLILESAILGALVAWDLLVFYVFWEIMLIPMYFIIGVWGSEHKIYATVKFFIYTMAGSLFMFLAILWIYIEVGSFNFYEIYNADIVDNVQVVLFIAFALSFAIKVPLFPFHTWLPDAHVQAPTAGSVILASVLLKMGVYGFIRLAIPIFPYATTKYSDVLSILAIIGIIYGAMMALAQTDIKKLIAYSSISHLGFVMLGLFAFTVGDMGNYEIAYQSIQGAIYQMINHGISTGALFLLVGMIYDRRHTKEMSDFGGLAKVMPIYAVIFMLTTLSSIGLPGLNGFIGEFLVLMGAFKANWVYGVLASSGVILGAVYMLVLYQRVFLGDCTNEANHSLKDLSLREIILVLPLVVMMFVMGILPGYFLDKIGVSLNSFFDNIANIGWMP